MKLFHYPWSPFARKALLAARELHILLDEQLTVPFDKSAVAELRAKTFPLATVPLLLLNDGAFIAHSSSIIEYLDLQSPEPGRLVPRDAKQAIAVRGFDRLGEELLEPTRYLTWALRKASDQQNHKRIAAMRLRINAVLGVFDSSLAGKTFLHGDRFTMADIAPCCAISVLIADRTLAREHLKAWTDLERWYSSIEERPAWLQMEACAARVPRPPELA